MIHTIEFVGLFEAVNGEEFWITAAPVRAICIVCDTLDE